MSDKQVFFLRSPSVRQAAARALAEAFENYRVEISPPKRNADQNAKLHAMFSEVARKKLHLGRTLTATQWKTLFISAHSIATGQGADMVPGLEGEYVNIRESSATMSIARMSSLIEFVVCWCAENGVHLSQ